MSTSNRHQLDYTSVSEDALPLSNDRSFFSYSATSARFVDQDLPNDLISFLAIAQKLKIDFIPITWQSALEELGEGGTAKIRQSLVNVRLSFAFKWIKLKRIKLLSDSERDRECVFQALASEISVLGHPNIRYHANVVRLEGICWDFPEQDGAVRPVLVFEKARYGDLAQFSETRAGRNMSFEDRLKVCVNVANAILMMHSCGEWLGFLC